MYTINNTFWASERAVFDPALSLEHEATVKKVRDAYWVTVVKVAALFKSDPYDMYYIMENLPTAPRPYNCIRGILTSIFNLRATTIMQSDVTLDLFISFRDEYDSLV